MRLVDSNILIFSELEDANEHDLAKNKIKQIPKNVRIMINDIIVSEVFHQLTKPLGIIAAKRRVENILASATVQYFPIEVETVRRALNLAETRTIRINDALIAQHAIDSKADGILTDNVKDFKKISGLKVLPLR